MPERWERELAKLRNVEPSTRSVRERVERGASVVRSSGRQRLIAGTVGAVVFVAAAAFAWGSLRLAPDVRRITGGELPAVAGPPLVISANAEPGQTHAPEATARYGGVSAAIPVQGGEGWDIGKAFPAAMFGPHDAAIPIGAPLIIDSNAETLEVAFNQSYPDGVLVPQELSSMGRLTLPSDAGDLLIQLNATWAEGRAEFSVFLHVHEPVVALEADCRASKVPVWQTRVVSAQPAGIHARFLSDGPREVRIDAPGFTSRPITTLEPGSTTLDLPIPPGIATVACNDAPASQITVVDPGGFWVPSELSCPAGDVVVPVAAAVDERLIDEGRIARRLLTLQATDRVLFHGYPEMPRVLPLPTHVVVRRGDRIVATLDMWLGKPARVGGEACASDGIRPLGSEMPSEGTPDPEGSETTPAAALRVRCTPDGAEVLTPVVAAQVDGLHIVPVDTPNDWEIFLFPESEPQRAYAAGSDDTDDEFVRPVSPGGASIACIDQETYSTADMARAKSHAASFLLTDPGGFFTPYQPECALSEQRSVTLYPDGVVIDDASAVIRTITGVREDDIVELAGYDWEWGSAREWRIVRGGTIVANLSVGNQGGGHISGSACVDSGIVGEDGP